MMHSQCIGQQRWVTKSSVFICIAAGLHNAYMVLDTTQQRSMHPAHASVRYEGIALGHPAVLRRP